MFKYNKKRYNIKEETNLLTDLLGWYKRNHFKMNLANKKKALFEINQIRLILEKDIREAS
jgi:hypothetical protein